MPGRSISSLPPLPFPREYGTLTLTSFFSGDGSRSIDNLGFISASSSAGVLDEINVKAGARTSIGIFRVMWQAS
jgi:hypothetical protein